MEKDSQGLVYFGIISLCVLSGLTSRAKQKSETDKRAKDRQIALERIEMLKSRLSAPAYGYNISEPEAWMKELKKLDKPFAVERCVTFMSGLQDDDSPLSRLNKDVAGVITGLVAPQ
jgi:hypothetical protein